MQWYEGDVSELTAQLAARPVSEPAVFYGSSSIRQWTTLSADLKNERAVNAGFGGSTLEACAFFFERIVPPLAPPRCRCMRATTTWVTGVLRMTCWRRFANWPPPSPPGSADRCPSVSFRSSPAPRAGRSGDRVIVFPTRQGRFYDYENWGIVDAVRDRIEAGALQLFCVDSYDSQSLYAHDIAP